MRKVFFILTLGYSFYVSAQSNYEKSWQLLNQNKWSEASRLLADAKQENEFITDAYITQLYIDAYKGKESTVTDFLPFFYNRTPDPYPYVYALWFNQGLVGGTGKKHHDHQLKLVNKLLDDEKTPGTIRTSAHYQMGMNYLFSNNFRKAQTHFDKIENIRNWQFVGPFENISYSGFYKEYGPLNNPQPGAVFKSISNADVKWFTPAHETREGWIPVSYQFRNTTAVVYAQSFVNSESDQTLFCSVGTAGSIKVWINDELIIAEREERITEMDTYVTRCHLKKGTNRILVQLGFTDNSFANFILRFTDDRFRSVASLTGSPVYSEYPKATKTDTKENEKILPFAETFFTERIKASPDNLVNYLLLSDVYLRNSKVIEARNTISDAIEKAPENCLLKMKMAEVLIKENNRTLFLEEIEKIKQLDPASLLVLDLNIKDLLKDQKYDEMAKELERRIRNYGEDESTADYKLTLLIQEKKYDELVKEVEKLYGIYPWNQQVLKLMFAVKKNVYKDNKGAMGVYEKYMKDNFNYQIYEQYIEALAEQGDNDKVREIKLKLAELFPYSPHEFYNLASHYYGMKQYDKAEEYINKALALAPYTETYWEYLGDVYNEKQKTREAYDAYNRSLKYDPNQYDLIDKIRKLDNKPETYKILAQPDIDAIIKSDNINEARNKDYGYYFICDQKDVILHPGGATEEFYINVIRITNEKGVDRYKESSISYGNYQSLLIEKAEIVKKNGTRLEGEKNDNEVVFTNLEVGDVIVFKFRIRNYLYGRLAKYYWDRYIFGGSIYSARTQFSIYNPDGQFISYKFNNYNLEPQISKIENFTKYSWEVLKIEPDKDEPLMPPVSDVCATLHVSTVPSWNDIANWYSDISSNKAEEDFEIIALYKQLFPSSLKPINQYQKAKIIYEHIANNIRYSSVSFRQSAYVPQRPSLTLTTRLGDCKDLSSLFVTLCRMAGINSHMVLLNTRDNGLKQITLPSVEFNHCIVNAELDGKSYYVELTDNKLPFNTLPNNVIGAAILEIPYRKVTDKAELKFLQPENRKKDIVKRILSIKPVDNDLQVQVKSIKYGAPSSPVRSSYLDMDNEKLILEFEKTVASNYKNNIKMLSASVTNLENLLDSVQYEYSYHVKNEIAEIGSIKTFRIVYPDIVATLDRLSADTRTYPVDYWSYEDVDQYETTVTISAPTGTKFIEVPVSETLAFKDMKFSLHYTLKAPDKLIVTRKFVSNRQNIMPVDYPGFKAFFEKIVRAEQKFIAFK